MDDRKRLQYLRNISKVDFWLDADENECIFCGKDYSDGLGMLSHDYDCFILGAIASGFLINSRPIINTDDETNVKTEGDEVVIEKSGCIELVEIQEAINAAVEMFGGDARIMMPEFMVNKEACTVAIEKRKYKETMPNSGEYKESKDGEDYVRIFMGEIITGSQLILTIV